MFKNKKIIIAITALVFALLILPFPQEGLSHNSDITLIPMEYYNRPEPVDPDYLKVKNITGWDVDIAKYFVDECRDRNVSVFEEALPVAFVESNFRFDVVNNNNRNGTSDFGVFQINSNTYPYIVKMLKQEGREFENWDRLNPHFNIAAGLLWLSYLKNEYNLEQESLFSSYNLGVTGAKNYAIKNGTYETAYSRKINETANIINKY